MLIPERTPTGHRRYRMSDLNLRESFYEKTRKCRKFRPSNWQTERVCGGKKLVDAVQTALREDGEPL